MVNPLREITRESKRVNNNVFTTVIVVQRTIFITKTLTFRFLELHQREREREVKANLLLPRFARNTSLHLSSSAFPSVGQGGRRGGNR